MLKENEIVASIRRAFSRYGMPVTLAAFAVPGVALGQAVDAPEPSQPTQAQQPAAAPVDVVVVTAQRRKERLVNVPISITSLSAGKLENAGISDTKGLMQSVPGMRMDFSGSYAQPSIRGVGSALAGPGMNSNVAIYVDGFYVPNLLGSDFDLLSISSIDVLKGPQGTLFGRNATGGAILVTTREPSQEPTATVSATYASFNRSKLNVYGSTGVSESVAVDIAAVHEQGDGFVRNIVTGNKDGKFKKDTVRVKIAGRINSAAKLTLTLEHHNIDDPSGNATSAYEGLSIGSVIPGTQVATRDRETSGTAGSAHTFKSNNILLRGDFDLGFADLATYTMSRDEEGFELKDYDGSPVPAFSASWRVLDKTVSQELVLTSKKSGALTWAAGAFFYRNKNTYPSFNINSGGVDVAHVFDSKIIQSSRAVFGDVTYEAAKNLFLTAGVRYSKDSSEASYNAPAASLSRYAEHDWSNTSPRGVVRYQITPDSNVYASYSLGYKAGLIPITEGTNIVDPEKVKAFEVGYKLARPGGLRFDISAFDYDYSNLQVASYIGTISLTRNAAQSKIRGVDLQLGTDLWTPALKLNAGLTYTKANYEAFTGAVDYVQDLSLPARPTYGTFLNPSVDASGNQMLRTPRFTGNLGLTYHMPLGDGTLVLAGNYYRTSKIYFDPVNRFSQDGYGLLNVSATYDINPRWSLTVFGKNVTDTVYRNNVLPGPVAIQQSYGEPASYGATVSYHF